MFFCRNFIEIYLNGSFELISELVIVLELLPKKAGFAVVIKLETLKFVLDHLNFRAAVFRRYWGETGN